MTKGKGAGRGEKTITGAVVVSTLAGERIAGKRILDPSWFTGLAVLSPGPLLHLS